MNAPSVHDNALRLLLELEARSRPPLDDAAWRRKCDQLARAEPHQLDEGVGAVLQTSAIALAKIEATNTSVV